MLHKLYRIVQDRKENPRDGSYTNQLLEAGYQRIAQKLGEEPGRVKTNPPPAPPTDQGSCTTYLPPSSPRSLPSPDSRSVRPINGEPRRIRKR